MSTSCLGIEENPSIHIVMTLVEAGVKGCQYLPQGYIP